jgi:hypothetical protein
MTTRWFKLMAMVGSEGAKEASGAMDDSKESTDAFIILLSIKAAIAQITVKKLIAK